MDDENDDYILRTQGHVTVVRLKVENLTGTGDIHRIQDALNGLVDGGVRRLVVDFKYVKYAASAALGMLLGLQKKLSACSGHLVLSRVDNISALLDVSRTRRMFQIATDPKEAVKLLS